ncbi:MAG: hypothetical protein HQ453_07385 [Actinobacteria bacterium]|nr:hypothetical protein [Actinomycetota bacterium]
MEFRATTMLTFFEVLTVKAGASDDIDPATDDVDVLLNIEIDTTAVAQANEHITALGYQLSRHRMIWYARRLSFVWRCLSFGRCRSAISDMTPCWQP